MGTRAQSFQDKLKCFRYFQERVSTPFHSEGTLRASFNVSKHYNIKFSFFNQVRIACPNTMLAIYGKKEKSPTGTERPPLIFWCLLKDFKAFLNIMVITVHIHVISCKEYFYVHKGN